MRTAHSALVLCVLLVAAAATPVAAAAPADASTTAADAPAVADADAEVNATRDDGTTITILSYNDIQTAIAQNGTVPQLATLVEQRRAAHDNPTVLLGGGDQVSPHSLAPISEWRTPVDVLNEMQPDAEVVGNHDLDYGFDAVGNFSEASEFPWLLANVVDEETGEPVPGTEPYTVVEKDGVRVGVVGLVDEKIKSKTAVDFDEQGYELQNYSEVGSEYATQLKEEENADVVVALGHFGVPVAEEFANSTENVDVVLVGDDEIEYPPQETDGVVISEAEARAAYLSETNLTVQDGEVTDWDGRLIPTTENVSHDENVSEVIETARGEQLSQVAGQTEIELDARFSSNYHDETNFGNLITDAFRWKSGADVAITNAGGIRSDGQYGPRNVTAGDVFSVLPFNNHPVTVELTGAQLEQVLESQVVTLDSETGQQYGSEAQLQVSGVTYEWVGHESTDDQLRSVYVNGDPLNSEATYAVTVNSYMAGWDGSPLANATRTDVDYTMYGEVVYNYIEEQGTVAPEGEDRIRRVNYETDAGSAELDGEGEVSVSFDAPPADNASVDADSVYALNSENERVNATDASVEDGTVTATFADGDLRTLAESGDVELYGHYSVGDRERPYFDASVLNAEVDANVVQQTTTAAPTTTAVETTAAETTAAATTSGESGGTSPGFGIGAAVVAALAAALLAHRD